MEKIMRNTQEFKTPKTLSSRTRDFLTKHIGYPWTNHKIFFWKSILYRIFSVIFTFLLAFMITGSGSLSLGISVFEIVSKTIMYYLFEVGWDNIHRKL